MQSSRKGGSDTFHPVRVRGDKKHRLEDVLSCIDQKRQGLRKELTEKIGERQVDLEAVKTSIDTRAKNLQETLADAVIDLHEQPGLMLLVEAQTMKAEIRNNQEKIETKIDDTRRESGL